MSISGDLAASFCLDGQPRRREQERGGKGKKSAKQGGRRLYAWRCAAPLRLTACRAQRLHVGQVVSHHEASQYVGLVVAELLNGYLED